MAGVAGFEPTNDGVRGKFSFQKNTVFVRFLPKNCRFLLIFRKFFPKFPQFSFPKNNTAINMRRAKCPARFKEGKETFISSFPLMNKFIPLTVFLHLNRQRFYLINQPEISDLLLPLSALLPVFLPCTSVIVGITMPTTQAAPSTPSTT